MPSKTMRKAEPGYQLPGGEESAFYEGKKPDYFEWATRKELTIQEAAALAIGLDPSTVPDFGNSPVKDRYEATLRHIKWALENYPPVSERLDLTTFYVEVVNWQFNVPPELEEAVDVMLQDNGEVKDALVSRLLSHVEEKNKHINRLQEILAKLMTAPKRRTSDEKHAENTSNRMILALVMARHRDEAECEAEIRNLAKGNRTAAAKKVTDSLIALKWPGEHETVLPRLRSAAVEWVEKNPEV